MSCGTKLKFPPLSAFQFKLWVYFFVYVSGRFFLLHLFIIFGVGLHAYFNHSLFLTEHIFVGFNEFPSPVCWCTVIHHHRPSFFSKSKMGFYVCAACMTQDLFKVPSEQTRLVGNVQLIPYPMGLQQNKHQEWKLNLCLQCQHQITSPTQYPSATAPDKHNKYQL